MINSLPLNHLVEIMRTSSCVRQNFFGDKSDNTSNILKSFDEFIAKTNQSKLNCTARDFIAQRSRGFCQNGRTDHSRIFTLQCVCVCV